MRWQTRFACSFAFLVLAAACGGSGSTGGGFPDGGGDSCGVACGDATSAGSCLGGQGGCIAPGAPCSASIVGQDTCPTGFVCCDHEGFNMDSGLPPPPDGGADASDAPSATCGAVPFACDTMSCDPTTQYCEIDHSPLPDGGSTGQCKPLTAGCACSCACVGMMSTAGSPGACGCYESPSGQITVGFCPP